ncbi:putative spermidine/putrescine transport system ATP-binding protein [Xaviernesmea oryzae]|uniref:Putative spermidine/putrescine transport system ATP-binding protein n=1 Tax=Xaviernesmea oryzae TaxID=464029 RepID=A0A1X7FV34_9HYPH|nr:ABC transporter ATP-binding protein [Xaviernesmea oryzae]SMF59285.1 putative spermidine/putrescine transport system ATP-binding protein [Xaviernesmea oryzae]
MTERKTKLTIRGLTKRYGAATALDHVDLDLTDGEFLTMLGPSGSGKTTLLWSVAGLNHPDGGKIWIDGRDATSVPASGRDIGMVFQNYALFPHLSVSENISFPLEMRKVSPRDRSLAITRALEMVKLEHVGDRFCDQLSGGQQQRIALARAFVANPSIILMDEPLGALDKKLRDHLQLEIKRLHERLGMTVLYVTHDQEEAMVMSDRICLMNQGRIEQIGTPDELYFQPKSLFAADFLGEANLIPSRITGEEAGCLIVELLGMGTVRTRSTPPRPNGPNVVHFTRPESIAIQADAENKANRLYGHVSEVVVSGAITKLFVHVGDALMKISLLTSVSQRVREGERITIGWDDDVGRVLSRSQKEAA